MAGGKVQDYIKDDQSEMPSGLDTGGGMESSGAEGKTASFWQPSKKNHRSDDQTNENHEVSNDCRVPWLARPGQCYLLLSWRLRRSKEPYNKS